MTPKEKAEELVKGFKSYSYYDAHDLTTRFQRERSNVESAIECALIAVDELINVCEGYDTDYVSGVGFYQLVKKELENLL